VTDDILQEQAIEVIKPLIPPDAEDRVTRSYRQWNQIVRDHIRNETELKLADGDGRNAVSVKVVDGFPVGLAHLIGRYSDPVLWRLIVGQPKLGGVVEGLTFLLDDWQAFEQWPQLPPTARNGRDPMHRTVEIVNALQQAALTERVRKDITAIDEDILGVYHTITSNVEIFWMPIAMVAAMLDVRIEDLTVVVLAHELTHGYTHIGRDIDGLQWDNEVFRRSDHAVVEGLAQFYTEVVTNKIAQRSPGPKLAYERLLGLQSGPYLAHQTWGKEGDRQRGETVRFTMVAARSRDPMKHDAWLEMLEATKKNLAKMPTKPGLFDEP